MKQERIKIAQSTLHTMDKGYYSVNGDVVDVKMETEDCISKSKMYLPFDLEELVKNRSFEKRFETKIEVINETTLCAAKLYIGESNRLGVLNFASAKNPGGGFMNGAQSQEESLARSSSLYPAIDQFQEMYKYNRSQSTFLYSDYMIYSPGVPVFKNDAGEFLEETYLMDILTSSAVNVGAMIQHGRRQEMTEANGVMKSRIDKMLALFADNNCDKLILGAWGCGVFRNNPSDIAKCFEHYLKKGAKYDGVFDKVVFSVLDRNKSGIYDAFEDLIK